MALAQTKAAEIMQQQQENISSHQVISLLLDGALERVTQAKACIDDGNFEDKNIIVGKIIGIINGLRGSLNFQEGGDIAVNLDALYDYMITRIDGASPESEVQVLDEVSDLINQVKSGWDEIEIDTPVQNVG